MLRTKLYLPVILSLFSCRTPTTGGAHVRDADRVPSPVYKVYGELSSVTSKDGDYKAKINNISHLFVEQEDQFGRVQSTRYADFLGYEKVRIADPAAVRKIFEALIADPQYQATGRSTDRYYWSVRTHGLDKYHSIYFLANSYRREPHERANRNVLNLYDVTVLELKRVVPGPGDDDHILLEGQVPARPPPFNIHQHLFCIRGESRGRCDHVVDMMANDLCFDQERDQVIAYLLSGAFDSDEEIVSQAVAHEEGIHIVLIDNHIPDEPIEKQILPCR